MPAKSKMTDKKNLTGINERDCFQTPKYATQLLVPYVPDGVSVIWECAAGEGRIARVLLDNGFGVASTDLKQGINFLVDDYPENYDAIVTNPPFSLKEEFFRQCIKYNKSFALLIPFEWNGWMHEAFEEWNCQALVPNRRINYITPNTLRRIHEGEIWRTYLKDEFGDQYKNLKIFKEKLPKTWEATLRVNKSFHNYTNIDDAPKNLLHKYSSSDFHSGWLTRGFNLPKQITGVKLSIEEIKNNI